MARNPVNWLNTNALCPSATNWSSCSTRKSILAEPTERAESSTNPGCRLNCRSRVSDRKIWNRFFSQSPSSPSTFCRSLASRVS